MERALDAVDMLPEGHEVRHNPRPMMSLLFPGAGFCRPLRIPETGQTTIATIPVMTAASVMIAIRRTMTMSRMRIVRHVAVAAAIATLPTKSVPKTIAMKRDNRDNRNDDADNDEEGGSRKSRRSRRLNAQERRAAAEVEQIEEDLILDDITYAPIDDETRNRHDDDDDEQPTRTRRRRRSRGNREEADEQQRDSDEGESPSFRR